MRLVVSVLLLGACAIFSSATPIKQNEVSSPVNRMVRAAPSSKPRNARRGCATYGHSCFGGYGKRDTPVPRGLPGSPGAGAGAPDAASDAAAAAAAALLDDAAYRMAMDMHPVRTDYPAYILRQLMPASASGRSPVWSSRSASRHGGDWAAMGAPDLGLGEVVNLREDDRGDRDTAPGPFTGTRLVGRPAIPI